jgi:hypothetical protein
MRRAQGMGGGTIHRKFGGQNTNIQPVKDLFESEPATRGSLSGKDSSTQSSASQTRNTSTSNSNQMPKSNMSTPKSNSNPSNLQFKMPENLDKVHLRETAAGSNNAQSASRNIPEYDRSTFSPPLYQQTGWKESSAQSDDDPLPEGWERVSVATSNLEPFTLTNRHTSRCSHRKEKCITIIG